PIFAGSSTFGSWYGVTVTNGDITFLDLSVNNLTGTIPTSIGNLKGLNALFLSWNNLTGSIPPTLGDLPNIQTLYLFQNRLTGGIPPEIYNLRTLTFLALEN